MFLHSVILPDYHSCLLVPIQVYRTGVGECVNLCVCNCIDQHVECFVFYLIIYCNFETK